MHSSDIDVDDQKSCFWEHEAIANYLGEDKFRHPDCITRTILGTSVIETEGGAQLVEVGAYGYYGEDRVSYVTVRGNDGNDHSVPVSWTEYLPISESSRMLVFDPILAPSDDQGWEVQFSGRGVDLDETVMWRGIRAAKL